MLAEPAAANGALVIVEEGEETAVVENKAVVGTRDRLFAPPLLSDAPDLLDPRDGLQALCFWLLALGGLAAAGSRWPSGRWPLVRTSSTSTGKPVASVRTCTGRGRPKGRSEARGSWPLAVGSLRAAAGGGGHAFL